MSPLLLDPAGHQLRSLQDPRHPVGVGLEQGRIRRRQVSHPALVRGTASQPPDWAHRVVLERLRIETENRLFSATQTIFSVLFWRDVRSVEFRQLRPRCSWSARLGAASASNHALRTAASATTWSCLGVIFLCLGLMVSAWTFVIPRLLPVYS